MAALKHEFLDLGFSPPSNAYISSSKITAPEISYPLRVCVCDECWLVQTEDYPGAGELFGSDYAYFSSTSKGWLTHAKTYAEEMARSLELGPHSMVLEIASNDGYLLRNFVMAGIPCLGIEPTESTATAAESVGVPVLKEFFSEELGHNISRRGYQADLIIGNNVYAHVPDINDFTRGIKAALKQGGTLTLEFPHLLRLIENTQFDTVYHEHFSYLSLYTVVRILRTAGLRVFDVRELPTHGGSLRVYGCHDSDSRIESSAVASVLQLEANAGLQSLAPYLYFQERANRVKDDLLEFLLTQKRKNKVVAAYGAAAKGNTLLNFAGVKNDLLPVVFDAASSKQGKYMPGSHIPILAPTEIYNYKPDFLLILPWNISEEIRAEWRVIESWGGAFVTAVPSIRVLQIPESKSEGSLT
jgi:SAM-dependent methyltransferase